MGTFLKVILGALCIFSLTGCFGEENDYSPPTVSIMDPDDIDQYAELAAANITWESKESGENYDKKTDDIQALATKTVIVELKAQQDVVLLMEDGHYDRDRVDITLWKDGNQTDLQLKNDESFTLPEEKGDYLIEVVVRTNLGTAQYVGSITIS